MLGNSLFSILAAFLCENVQEEASKKQEMPVYRCKLEKLA